MVRLNADLIWKSPHFFNATKERELDLRGNKITIIENIDATEDQFDTIDLSDNDIVKLENFPFMNRLGTLLINNNRITHINRNLGEILHKMHTLVLTNNCLTSLAEIDPLASLPKLQFLSLLDNTVTKQPDYRLYVIHKLKHLRLLDFKEVKQQEKTEAAQKFHSKETEETEKRVATKSYTPGQVGDSEGTTKNQGAKVVSPTAAQITAIKAALVNSQTLHEVPGLEKALSAGQVRAEFAFPKPDTNMAQASEEAKAEKMETDGQDQEDGADEQKETDESTLIQEERSEAGQKFHSKEAEEAAKKVAAKAYSPVVMDTQGTTKNQGPEVVAPTPAQMTAIKAAIMNSQPLDELGLEKEFLGADLDSIYDTLSHIESYMYQNFERAPFNFIVSWRKRFFHGMHILPPPRRQEPDDCAYHATLALMECGFKVMYANRFVGTREFNIKLSHKHLKQLVHDYLTSKEGKGFKPRDLLLVCLGMAMRHGVISEEDYDKGRVREAIRYHILSYTELSADEMRDIPRMLHEDAKMVLTSFRVTPRYRVLLPHEIYRYVPSEDPACQPWTGDKKPSHVSHCVVLTGPGLAYKAPEDCDTEAELSTPERYFEYLNSYSSGYGVDGCGFIFADSIRKCYIVDV